MFDTRRATVSSDRGRAVGWAALVTLAVAVLSILVWQGVTADGAPDPTVPGLHHRAIVLDAGVLVFREGLEAILVLAAISSSFVGAQAAFRRPVAAGSGAAILATVATWFIVIAIIGAINAPALDVQAGTGLLAVLVLLVVMNWFFHRIYWTGWIAHHNRRRRDLVQSGGSGVLLGLALLGFTAVYREGFEIVLFLQTLRLQAGSGVVLQGVAIGLGFTAAVAILTFMANRKLPYKRMLVLTGVLLGFVLVVMVGESVQEMQLAGWVSTTPVDIPAPDWLGIWFAFFPTVETIVGQALAALLVIGSYVVARETRLIRMPGRSTT
jgi:high-affinity iron transporter